MNNSKNSVRTLTMLALLVAMSIVFSRVLSISTGFVRFNLGSLPVLLAALLFDLIYRDTADKTKATRTAGAVFAACLIALGVFYATVFVQIKDYSVGREAYVQAQIDRGEKKIYLPMYPAYTGDYIRGSTPKDGSIWEERYKMFYHIDPDIDLVTVGPNTPQAKAVLAQEK